MSLQLWLPLNGNTNNQGLSNISMSGTVNYSDGILGKCAIFSGSVANIIYNNTKEFNYTDNFSWCVWIRTNYTGTAGQYAFTVGRADAGGFGYGLQCINTTTCQVRFGSGNYSTTNVPVTGGQWTHLAFTKHGSTIKIYKNGTLFANITFTGSVPTYSDGNGLGLGCFHYTGDIYAFYGSLSDFRIYDHCLSPKEVKEISKGLTIHLPLSWGGNPNLYKGSMSVFSAIHGNGNLQSMSKIYDESLGQTVMKVTVTNSTSSDIPAYNGVFVHSGEHGPVLESDKTYTTSFYAKSDIDNITIAPNIAEGRTITSSDLTMTTSWKKCYATFNSTSTSVTTCFYVPIPANTTYSFYIALPKCEEGNIYTPWVPNVSDKEYTTFGFDKAYADDCSGYNRNATVTNCLPDASCPRYSTSTKFATTSDKVVLTSSLTSGQTMTEFTTAIWAKINTLNSTTPNIISLGQNSFWRFRIATATSVWYYVRVGSTQVYSTYTTKNLIDNAWHHYALTFKDGVVRLYIDGIQVGTTDHSATAKYITCASTNWILHSYDGTAEAFVGSLSDCRIYHSCLSADDVKELYQTPISIDKSGKLFCNSLVEE